MPSSDHVIMPISSRRPADLESPPGSSRSGDTPLGQEYPPENESSLLARKGEAQSWTFEEQFRQVRMCPDKTITIINTRACEMFLLTRKSSNDTFVLIATIFWR